MVERNIHDEVYWTPEQQKASIAKKEPSKQEIVELKIDQFLTQQYGWESDKTLREIFAEHGLKQILRDFQEYLERDK